MLFPHWPRLSAFLRVEYVFTFMLKLHAFYCLYMRVRCVCELNASEASGHASSVRHWQSGVHEWVNQACNHSEFRPRVKDATARTDGGRKWGEKREREMAWWKQLIWGEMCRWNEGKEGVMSERGETDEGKAGWSTGMKEWETAGFWPMEERGYECFRWNGWLGRKIEEISRWGEGVE